MRDLTAVKDAIKQHQVELPSWDVAGCAAMPRPATITPGRPHPADAPPQEPGKARRRNA